MGRHEKYRALAGIATALWAAPAGAACQLALALGLDVSSSIDEREYVLQRDGLAAALLSEPVQALLFSDAGEVAIAVYEWSGLQNQHLILDWTLLGGPGALQSAAETIHAARRQRNDLPTAIGAAIGYSASLFRRAPDCLRQTLDISGDGFHNHGFDAQQAYDAFPLDPVTVNGLVIVGHFPELVNHYLTKVIKGPGAFVEVTPNFDRYEEAMQRKLLREIGMLVIGRIRNSQEPQG